MGLSRRQFVTGAIAAAGGGQTVVSSASAQTGQRNAVSSAPISPGPPTLVVRDLSRVASYYEERIGLERIDLDRGDAHLGAGGRTLLVLRKPEDAEPEPPGSAGLYHTAFLLPSRAELGAWLARAIRTRLPLDGVSDHRVSESLYLTDPEGNGIEVYADRPRSSWKWVGGTVEMGNEPLDVKGILEAGAALAERERVPAATSVGHVHLRVGGIPAAEDFYGRVVGLDITRRRDGATFYATGRYHHHLATNTWESAGSRKRTGLTTGLGVLSLIAHDGPVFEASAERLLAAGGKRQGDTITAEDPWGNAVLLSRA